MEHREENLLVLNRSISPFHCHLLGTDLLSRLPWNQVLVGTAGSDPACVCERIFRSRSALGARSESVADGRASCSVKQKIMQLKTGEQTLGMQGGNSHCHSANSQCSSEYLPVPQAKQMPNLCSPSAHKAHPHNRAVIAKFLSFNATSTQIWVSQELLHFSCAFPALGW